MCVYEVHVSPLRTSPDVLFHYRAQRLAFDWPWQLHTTSVCSSPCSTRVFRFLGFFLPRCAPLIKWVRQWRHVFACELSCAREGKGVLQRELFNHQLNHYQRTDREQNFYSHLPLPAHTHTPTNTHIHTNRLRLERVCEFGSLVGPSLKWVTRNIKAGRSARANHRPWVRLPHNQRQPIFNH